MKKIIKDILKKQIILIISIFVIAAIHQIFYIQPSKILGNIFDLLYDINNNKALFLQYIKMLIGASVVILVLNTVLKCIVARISRGFERRLKNKVFESFLQTNLTDIQNVKNGELMSYFTKDVSEIRSFLYRICARFTKMFFGIIIAVYMMQKVSINLTIAVMIPTIITLVIIIILKKLVEKSFKKAQKCYTELSEFVQENTDSIRTTKAYSGEENKIKIFKEKNNKLRKSDIILDAYSNLLSIVVSICFGISYAIIVLYGSHLVINNTITVGDFVAFNGYITSLVELITWIPAIISSFERAKISYKRLEKVFNLNKEISNFDNENLQSLNGDIEFRNLSFKYPNTEENALKNINLKIKQGSTLGIIGTIGSGKTTLVSLLENLYQINKGELFINGQDINDIDIITLRNNICYITQDNFLFSNTIKENIKLFKEIYEENEINQSARDAMLEEDLNNLKEGIKSVIGERGIDLSGGQKQRVVISRAFLRKSNIVIFDDTFSALDNKTEEKVLNNIKNLTKGKTCIMISNRISDVKDADHIIVLDEGKIVEEGTHNQLLENSGLYNKFYNKQIAATI